LAGFQPLIRFLGDFSILQSQISPKTAYENASPSPDSSGNPFYGGVRHEKIAAHSGKQLLTFIIIPIFQMPKLGFDSAQPDKLYLYIIYVYQKITRQVLVNCRVCYCDFIFT